MFGDDEDGKDGEDGEGGFGMVKMMDLVMMKDEDKYEMKRMIMRMDSG
jgi:hypothetical protein